MEKKISDNPRMGRPKIEIDWKELDKLCGLQCSLEEIAGWFDCSIDTIEARIKETHGMTFPEYFAQKRSGGKISLRRKQYETAMSGNPTMLIWLGKQYLGQVDKQETELKTSEIKVVIDQDDNDL
jgi:hypothetical protein